MLRKYLLQNLRLCKAQHDGKEKEVHRLQRSESGNDDDRSGGCRQEKGDRACEANQNRKRNQGSGTSGCCEILPNIRPEQKEQLEQR